MRLLKKILLLSIILIFISLFISEFLLGRYYYLFFSPTSCIFPNSTEYNICCKDTFGRIFSCKDRITFKCGEEIEILITLNNLTPPTFVCVKSNTLPANTSCFNLTTSRVFLRNEWGKIPSYNGNLTLLEVYTDHKTLLIVSRNVKC